MSKEHLSHEILNILERLHIMHDLVENQNYTDIPKAELIKDLSESLELLKSQFEKFVQY